MILIHWTQANFFFFSDRGATKQFWYVAIVFRSPEWRMDDTYVTLCSVQSTEKVV